MKVSEGAVLLLILAKTAAVTLCFFSADVLEFDGFRIWTLVSRTWASAAAAFIIIVPLLQEVSP
jgi:hypothetical protein